MSSGGLCRGDPVTRDQVGADFLGFTQNLPLRLLKSDMGEDAMDEAAALPCIHAAGFQPADQPRATRGPRAARSPFLLDPLPPFARDRALKGPGRGLGPGGVLDGCSRDRTGLRAARWSPSHLESTVGSWAARPMASACPRRPGVERAAAGESLVPGASRRVDGLRRSPPGGTGRAASPPAHCVVGRMDVSDARDRAHSTWMAKGILPSDPRRSSRCHSATHYPSDPDMAFDSQSGGVEW